jgi:hypothetical protein
MYTRAKALHFSYLYAALKGPLFHQTNTAITSRSNTNKPKAKGPTAKSQEPTAKSQQPRANSQEPTAKSQEPTANS